MIRTRTIDQEAEGYLRKAFRNILEQSEDTVYRLSALATAPHLPHKGLIL